VNGAKLSAQSKVGLFAIIALAVILYLTLRVSDLRLIPTGTYSIYLEMKSAEGIDHKTPVMVAGIQVGVVESIDLMPGNMARVKLRIKKGVVLPKDVKAEVRTKGVLGDVILELVPGKSTETLEEGGTVQNVSPYADFSEMTRNLNDVAINLKDISVSIKKYVNTEDSVVAKTLNNMERLTKDLANFSGKNRENMDQIVANLKDLTHDLKGVVRDNSVEVSQTLERMESITRKIDEGKGSIGKLVNDPSTAEKVDEALDNINGVVGGASRLETELGYHMEYLGNTSDFKHYITLNLKPRPDKYFILEFVSDPDPSPVRTTTTTNVTTGGTTTTVTADKEETDRNKLRISAELAKKFYDFTLRAGLIESTGGAGLDYDHGPFGLHFSAFDFTSGGNDNPHLKGWGTVNVTKGLYFLAGVDDFISKRHGPDWFVGFGIRFLDDDIKSLLGAFSLKP
jgi:phospholipid/cholesterol/gamma-HCH transport system substrate-binding protein